jgi:hypothetical protein
LAATFISAAKFFIAHLKSLRSTPAMALGIVGWVCTIGELIDAAPVQVPPSFGRRHEKPGLIAIEEGKL